MRPIKLHQKELQKQQHQRLKQERKEQRKQQLQVMKQFVNRIEEERNQLSKRFKISKDEPTQVLPKMPVIQAVYQVPVSHSIRTVSKGTQTVQRVRGPKKKSIASKKSKRMISTVTQASGHDMTTQASVSSQCMTLIGGTVHDAQTFQDSGMNTSLISASNIQTQTSVAGPQSTHTCTQTQGDVIVRNALLSANIETQTSCSHTKLVQSSTQYSSMYSAATAETQTSRLNLSLHHGPLFDLEAMSCASTSQTPSQVTSHPAVQTQTCMATVASSDAQTDSWLSALYETNSPGSDSPGSALSQPADVPTQTDLSFLDVLNFSHSETQTMNSLASFMTESSSTQTPLNTPNSSNSSSTSTTLL